LGPSSRTIITLSASSSSSFSSIYLEWQEMVGPLATAAAARAT
jgi:hypothetical protein